MEGINSHRLPVKGKLHSKVIISDLLDFFVKFDGEIPRSKLEQENSQTDVQKFKKKRPV